MSYYLGSNGLPMQWGWTVDDHVTDSDVKTFCTNIMEYGRCNDESCSYDHPPLPDVKPRTSVVGSNNPLRLGIEEEEAPPTVVITSRDTQPLRALHETETINLGSTQLVKVPFARPWDVPDPMVYVATVKEMLSQHPDDYTSFLSIISDWCQNDGSPVSMYNLIEKVFGLLSTRPRLFRDFNALLRINNYRIECSLDKEEVDFFMVVAPSGARIQAAPDVPLPFITNTAQLRSLPCSEWEKLTTLKSGWASCVLELLQTELDDERLDHRHRKKCLRCFRKLVRNSNELPPSFVLHHVVREGRSPVRCGGFADIWKGHINGQLVCFKVLRIFNMDNGRRKLVQSFCNEALVWRQLSHPNVLPFYGVNEDLFSPSLCLVSPWMKNGHIMNYLEANPHHDRIASISQIAAGLRYLHELHPRIVHGDIKGANVLVADDLTCCLADFGLSSVVETHTVNGATTSGISRGTMRWMAPELIDPDLFPNHDAYFKIPSDIYSFGCTMFEVFTGQPPFSDKKNDLAVMNCVLKGIRPPHPPPEVDFPNEIWTLVVSCWAHQPDFRPTANHVNGVLQRLSSMRAQTSQVITENEPAPPWYEVQTPTSIEVWLHREEERLAQTRNPLPAYIAGEHYPNNVAAPADSHPAGLWLPDLGSLSLNDWLPSLSINPLLAANAVNFDLSSPGFNPQLKHGLHVIDNKSLSKRDWHAAATVPPLAQMRIVCDLVPQWPIDLPSNATATHRWRKPLEVGQIFAAVREFLHNRISHLEWGMTSEQEKVAISKAYHQRCARYPDWSGEGVLRLDYLKEKVMWKGLVRGRDRMTFKMLVM